jgi:hypothetical protein
MTSKTWKGCWLRFVILSLYLRGVAFDVAEEVRTEAYGG